MMLETEAMNVNHIPNKWKVGIDAVDNEHKELFNILQTQLSNETKSAMSDQECYNTFYDRFSKLLAHKEAHMTEVGYCKLSEMKRVHSKTLEHLINLQKKETKNLIDLCIKALLREVANADLYYSNNK